MERAARIAIRTVREFLTVHTSMKKVTFVCHDDGTFRAYNKLLLAAVFDDTKSPVADMISAHLLMIESAYQIRIRNKEEIVQIISEVAENNIQALSAGISLNNLGCSFRSCRGCQDSARRANAHPQTHNDDRPLRQITLKTVLLMVRFTMIDPFCPVDLLEQDEPGHLVGKGHPGKREPHLAFLKDGLGKPEVPADYECKWALPL